MQTKILRGSTNYGKHEKSLIELLPGNKQDKIREGRVGFVRGSGINRSSAKDGTGVSASTKGAAFAYCEAARTS